MEGSLEEKRGGQQHSETGFQLFLAPRVPAGIGRDIHRLPPLLVQAGIKPFGAFSYQGRGRHVNGADGLSTIQRPFAEVALPVIDGSPVWCVTFHHGRGFSRSPVVFETQPASGFDNRQAVLFVRKHFPGQHPEPASAPKALAERYPGFLIVTAFFSLGPDNSPGNKCPSENELSPGTASLIQAHRIFSERYPFLCQLN